MNKKQPQYNALDEVIKLEVQMVAMEKYFRHLIDNNKSLSLPDASKLNQYHQEAVEMIQLKYEHHEGIDDLIY